MTMTRLEQLREENDFTKKKIAEILGISDSLYARWENGKEIIPTRRMYQIANYYKVNIDYLMGLTSNRITIISKVEIERNAKRCEVVIHTSKPGVIIGRGGEEINKMKAKLSKLVDENVQVSIMDVKNIDVGLSEKDGSLQVVSVDIELGNAASVQNDGSIGSIEIDNIEDISAGSNTEAASAMSGGSSRKMADGEDAIKLKEDISSYFVINKEVVNIWE